MQLDLEQLIKHPQTMDKETLYDLRSLIALYPYFQTARLLMLQTSTSCTTPRLMKNCARQPYTSPTAR